MNYKIGSFNLKNLGESSRRDFNLLARIIMEEEFDVIAFQEVLSEGKGVKRLLENFVSRELYNWDFVWNKPQESKDVSKLDDIINEDDSGDKRGEGYAFLWNKKKFKILEYKKLMEKRKFEPRIINSLSNDISQDVSFFARAPYYIRLQPLYGGNFELRLINIHIYYGDRTEKKINSRRIEYDYLTRIIYPEISKKRYGTFRTPYTIAMGDYNLNLLSPFVKTEAKNCDVLGVYTDSTEKYSVYTIQEKLSTLRNLKDGEENIIIDESDVYANNYDHFTYSPELSGFENIHCGVIDVVNKYCDGDYTYYRKNISDHLPIVMSIKI